MNDFSISFSFFAFGVFFKTLVGQQPAPADAKGGVTERVSGDPNCDDGADDGTIRTLNMIVRTRTDSGKPLTDLVRGY